MSRRAGGGDLRSDDEGTITLEQYRRLRAAGEEPERGRAHEVPTAAGEKVP